MHFVYVLQSQKDKKYYIGCTENIQDRLKYHNDGKVSSTKSRRPFILIYTEEFSDKYKAFNTERFYKTAKGKKVLLNNMALSSNG